jgi:hypothetical protein
MQAIQRMRQKAQQNGALQSTPEQTVTTTTSNGKNYIVIEPASPEVVYVPQYNPEAVWGASAYPYPSMYYPQGLGLISWGAGFALGAIWSGSWNNWGWNAGWGSNIAVEAAVEAAAVGGSRNQKGSRSASWSARAASAVWTSPNGPEAFLLTLE